jgi:apolipoprotein N-acyltransferase
VVICLATALAWTAFGVQRLTDAGESTVDGVALRIVQPNIAQADKWDPSLGDANFVTLLELSARRTGPEQLGLLEISHVIWPESAFPFLLTARPDALAAIGSTLPLGANLLAGAIRAEPRTRSGAGAPDRVFYNSIYALNDRGEIVDAYDKARLVPFGEMLPFSDFLETTGIRPLVSAPAGFVAGPGAGTLETSDSPAALALVCYEAIFSSFVRRGVVANDPGYLLNVTNDAWFGSSAGPHQHFHQARLRSVELGIPLVRAANTGISGVVDAYGRTQAALGLDERNVLDSPLPNRLETTVYRRLGDLPFAVLLFLVLSISLYHLKMKRRTLS